MGIRIVALRHAKPESESHTDDALRPLVPEGREDQKKLSQLLKQKGIVPTRILSSPLLRAMQTAEIMGDFFGLPIEEEKSLGNYFETEALLKILSKSPPNGTIFLVGHAPTLAEFLNKLTGKNSFPSGLSKSSAAIVDFKDHVSYGAGNLIDYIRV